MQLMAAKAAAFDERERRLVAAQERIKAHSGMDGLAPKKDPFREIEALEERECESGGLIAAL